MTLVEALLFPKVLVLKHSRRSLEQPEDDQNDHHQGQLVERVMAAIIRHMIGFPCKCLTLALVFFFVFFY